MKSTNPQGNPPMTFAERRVWKVLSYSCRKRNVICVPQADVFGYSADFWFPEYNIDVELDGPFHRPSKDSQRDAELLKNGVRVIRFKNPGNQVQVNAIWFKVWAEIRFQWGRRHPAERKARSHILTGLNTALKHSRDKGGTE